MFSVKYQCHHYSSGALKMHFGAHGHQTQYLMRLENCFFDEWHGPLDQTPVVTDAKMEGTNIP